jgi:hypothetical protein
MKSTHNHSQRLERHIIRTISNCSHKTEDPHSIHRPSVDVVVLEISIWFLKNHEVIEHHGAGINIIDKVVIWEENAETVQEAYRVGEPWYVAIKKNWRKSNQASNMMNEECFLANVISAIHNIFDRYIVPVVRPR